MYNFLYHFPNFIWAVLGVVLAVFDFINLIMYFFGDTDKKEDRKKYFVILLVSAVVCFMLYPIKNNLVEMPKIVDDIYSNAIQTLNEHEITHTLIDKNEEDIGNTNNWRVTYQSVSEGSIINKDKTVFLVLDEIVEEDSTDKDNSEITSNGDNTINIQNKGTINIDNSTKIIQSEDTTAVEYTEIFSVSEQLPQMPMLLNSSKKEALQIIKDLIYLYNLELNYKLNIIGNYEDEDDLIVIDQVPSNGEILERGTLIQLTVTSLYDIDNSKYNQIPIIDPFINNLDDIISGNNYRIDFVNIT